MNWLGAGVPTFLVSLLGAALGAFVHALLLRHGVDFPPIIALLASICAVLASRETSGMRGVVVASFSCWAGALVEVIAQPTRGVFWDLVHFSERLTALRLILYIACAVLGVVVASRARPGATTRSAAT